jgi:hypothetical protein
MSQDDEKTSEGLLATERECAEGRTAPRVSLADIEANIAAEYSFTASQAIGPGVPGHPSLDLLTIVILVTGNGFVIIGKSAPASPANFDADLGRKLAREDAVRQLWPLMGYALRDRLMREADAAANQRIAGMDAEVGAAE